MSPFIVLAVTAICAGLLIPALAIAAAKLGISDPFSLQVGRRKWTFAKWRRTSTANTAIRSVNSMTAQTDIYQEHASGSSVPIIKLAA